MKPKTKELTKQIMEAILDSPKITHIDSSDCEPVELSTDEYVFDASYWLEDRFDGKPTGVFRYTITVKGAFVPFNEDD
jgi:hypothetical protein